MNGRSSSTTRASVSIPDRQHREERRQKLGWGSGRPSCGRLSTRSTASSHRGHARRDGRRYGDRRRSSSLETTSTRWKDSTSASARGSISRAVGLHGAGARPSTSSPSRSRAHRSTAGHRPVEVLRTTELQIAPRTIRCASPPTGARDDAKPLILRVRPRSLRVIVPAARRQPRRETLLHLSDLHFGRIKRGRSAAPRSCAQDIAADDHRLRDLTQAPGRAVPRGARLSRRCRSPRSSCPAITTFRSTTSSAGCEPAASYRRYITEDLEPAIRTRKSP